MDIAKTATNMAETGTRQDVQFALQKKVQDIATSTATQLIDAIQPTPAVPNLPSHLGNTINTTA